MNTLDDSGIGYILEFYLSYPVKLKEKTKNIPFCPENKKGNPDELTPHMKNIKLDNYTQNGILICDWTDEMKYLIR